MELIRAQVRSNTLTRVKQRLLGLVNNGKEAEAGVAAWKVEEQLAEYKLDHQETVLVEVEIGLAYVGVVADCMMVVEGLTNVELVAQAGAVFVVEQEVATALFPVVVRFVALPCAIYLIGYLANLRRISLLMIDLCSGVRSLLRVRG